MKKSNKIFNSILVTTVLWTTLGISSVSAMEPITPITASSMMLSDSQKNPYIQMKPHVTSITRMEQLMLKHRNELNTIRILFKSEMDKLIQQTDTNTLSETEISTIKNQIKQLREKFDSQIQEIIKMMKQDMEQNMKLNTEIRTIQWWWQIIQWQIENWIWIIKLQEEKEKPKTIMSDEDAYARIELKEQVKEDEEDKKIKWNTEEEQTEIDIMKLKEQVIKQTREEKWEIRQEVKDIKPEINEIKDKYKTLFREQLWNKITTLSTEKITKIIANIDKLTSTITNNTKLSQTKKDNLLTQLQVLRNLIIEQLNKTIK